MHFSGVIGNLKSNHIWRCFWFLHWQKLPLKPLVSLLIFYLLVCKLYKSGLWIIHYILEVLRYTNIVYIGRYLVLTYIVRFFSTVCWIFSYICWSVNCMSWVIKFHNIFLTSSETEARFIFECFKYCPLWEVNFQLFSTFLAFFIWSVNCSKDFFSHFVSQ